MADDPVEEEVRTEEVNIEDRESDEGNENTQEESITIPRSDQTMNLGSTSFVSDQSPSLVPPSLSDPQMSQAMMPHEEEEVRTEDPQEESITVNPELCDVVVITQEPQVMIESSSSIVSGLPSSCSAINVGLGTNSLVTLNQIPSSDQTTNLASTSSATAQSRSLVTQNHEIPRSDQTMNLGSTSSATARIRNLVTQNQIPRSDQTMNLGSTSSATDRIRILVPPNLSETQVMMMPPEEEDDDLASLITQPPYDDVSHSDVSSDQTMNQEQRFTIPNRGSTSVANGQRFGMNRRQLSPYAEPWRPQNTYQQVQHQHFRSNQSAEPNRGAQDNFNHPCPNATAPMIIVPILVLSQASMMYQQDYQFMRPFGMQQQPYFYAAAPMMYRQELQFMRPETYQQNQQQPRPELNFNPQTQPMQSQVFNGGPYSYRGRGGHRDRARGSGRY